MNFPILPARFYGQSLKDIHEELEKKIEEAKKRHPVVYFEKPRSILQPSRYKEEFYKQNEALLNAATYSQDDDILCCFVFQDENEKRRFIVTYPEDFWSDTENTPLERRVFYEVIPEHTPCFLYYDLEFETEINPEKNGIQMTSTLIDITILYIAKFWDYHCKRDIVINLDSSRPGKFSKHLIFSTRDVAFENNYHVGSLVKLISSDIVKYLSHEDTNNEILAKFDKAKIEDLFVETNKGKKFFVDLNVYTKNRHFRVYKATKWGKNSHLVLAEDCEYRWNLKSKSKEMEIFLNSLISYIPRKKRLKLLSFDENHKAQIQCFSHNEATRLLKSFIQKEYPPSPYPVLDKFMSEYVKPGKIRDTKHMASQKIIVFEVVGNRFCRNINRWHKSNNIYYLVDLIQKKLYQKCHDEDCSSFISSAIELPEQVTFYFEDETDSVFKSLTAE
ncbi:hypothetical protein QAD02_005374 [Eretmocerus hayati]|uniref:Uncharacterized protein n=1 Tax=Eretmocerus hayati TaxID=131215 RepID=A0ACC2NV52_9HYME|nr:hypothetical protein QAD02_005374 [Eretmocerus hayati]